MQSLSPVKINERETFMDVLRGFAILGIFIANLNGLSWYGFNGPGISGDMLLPEWDKKMKFLHHMFIEGKFYSIFSFLFGWGIALQLKNSESKGVQPASFIRRRLMIMLFLGAFHLMLWPGDIVFLYGMLGFILLPLRRFSNKTLLITGIGLLLLPILLYWLKMKFPVLNSPAEFLYQTGDKVDSKLTGVTSEETFKEYIKNANWFDVFKGDISGFFFRYGDLFFQSRFPKVLGMMLIGLVAGRSEFYKKIHHHKKSLYYIIAFGIIIALPANYLLAGYMDDNTGSYYRLKISGLYRTISYAIGVAPLAAAYVALFMLAFQNNVLKRIMSVLAPVGKMAFSNYIMHTLIGNFVFLNAGLGFMGSVGPVYYTLFALLVFSFQVIFSTIWLTYFNYGPIEWIWRSATYKKWQPMVKQ